MVKQLCWFTVKASTSFTSLPHFLISTCKNGCTQNYKLFQLGLLYNVCSEMREFRYLPKGMFLLYQARLRFIGIKNRPLITPWKLWFMEILFYKCVEQSKKIFFCSRLFKSSSVFKKLKKYWFKLKIEQKLPKSFIQQKESALAQGGWRRELFLFSPVSFFLPTLSFWQVVCKSMCISC